MPSSAPSLPASAVQNPRDLSHLARSITESHDSSMQELGHRYRTCRRPWNSAPMALLMEHGLAEAQDAV